MLQTIIYHIKYFPEFQLYGWNITFTKINRISGLPPCYHEFLAVQEGHGSPGMIYGDENTQSQNVINKYQFCGVRSQLHLYPEDLNVEIIFENNKVITESEFSFQFQVIDHGLVKSFATGVMFSEIRHDGIQHLAVAKTLIISTFQILVNKLSEIILNIITQVSEKYIIYSGPIIHEQFRVKNFGGSMRILSFQCIVVVYSEIFPLTLEMKFSKMRQPAMEEINLKIDKEMSGSFPNAKCHYTYGTLCIIKVS